MFSGKESWLIVYRVVTNQHATQHYRRIQVHNNGDNGLAKRVPKQHPGVGDEANMQFSNCQKVFCMRELSMHSVYQAESFFSSVMRTWKWG